MDLIALNERIRDRISTEWLTPSQRVVWDEILLFDGPPHRVINIYGGEGTGKSFLGWLLEREQLATYGDRRSPPQPTYPRLTLDNASSTHEAVREVRPLVDTLKVRQIILLTRHRAEEAAMPAFELRVTADDLQIFYANLFRHLRITLPEADYHSYTSALESLG